MTAADRYLAVTMEGRRRAQNRARALANADALNRGDHADATLLERGRHERGAPGQGDRVMPRAPRLVVVK